MLKLHFLLTHISTYTILVINFSANHHDFMDQLIKRTSSKWSTIRFLEVRLAWCGCVPKAQTCDCKLIHNTSGKNSYSLKVKMIITIFWLSNLSIRSNYNHKARYKCFPRKLNFTLWQICTNIFLFSSKKKKDDDNYRNSNILK